LDVPIQDHHLQSLWLDNLLIGWRGLKKQSGQTPAMPENKPDMGDA
jgi:hypothetical protein